MLNTEFHIAISQARYLRYLSACGNKRRALKLYRANIALSQKTYAVIAVFEVILRNSIDRHMTLQYGTNWLENLTVAGGYFHDNEDCYYSLAAIQDAIQSLGRRKTRDALIAELSFAFWRSLFSPKQYPASGNTLLQIFVNAPRGTKQKDVLRRLKMINETRNRIAHHEPICFDGNLISTAKMERRYHTIIELLHWLGCHPQKILYGIDQVPQAIATINNITSAVSSSPAAS